MLFLSMSAMSYQGLEKPGEKTGGRDRGPDRESRRRLGPPNQKKKKQNTTTQKKQTNPRGWVVGVGVVDQLKGGGAGLNRDIGWQCIALWAMPNKDSSPFHAQEPSTPRRRNTSRCVAALLPVQGEDARNQLLAGRGPKDWRNLDKTPPPAKGGAYQLGRSIGRAPGPPEFEEKKRNQREDGHL